MSALYWTNILTDLKHSPQGDMVPHSVIFTHLGAIQVFALYPLCCVKVPSVIFSLLLYPIIGRYDVADGHNKFTISNLKSVTVAI